MIYLDDIAALQFWRSQDQPRLIRERCSTASTLRHCPTSPRDLKRQLAELPPWLPMHMMVGSSGCRPRVEGCEYSVFGGQLPSGSFYHIEGPLCVAAPELVYLQAARRLSLPQLVMLGDELCGLYALAKASDGCRVVREEPLTTPDLLTGFVARAQGFKGCKPARAALRHVAAGSASPMETTIHMALCLPKRHGGFGLPSAVLNHRIDFTPNAARIAGKAFARADLCWPEARLDIEYDSEQWHSTREQNKGDKARANALQSMDYLVIFVTKEQYDDIDAFEGIAATAAKRIGYRMRPPSPKELHSREQLRAEISAARLSPYFTTLVLP